MLVTCYGGGFDFEALKFSGVAAVLPDAFFPYHRFYNKERVAAADRPTKFILVLGNIYIYVVVALFNKNTLDFGDIQVVITRLF